MPTPLGHAIIGLSIYTLTGKNKINYFNNKKDVVLICFLSVLPDIDMIMVAITGDPFMHRTVTHSVFFSILAPLLLLPFYRKRSFTFHLRNSLIVFSHILADYFVKDGVHHSKVQLFYPYPLMVNSPVSLFLPLNWSEADFLTSSVTYIAFLTEIMVASSFFSMAYFYKKLFSWSRIKSD